ncbi:MAG: hypothetical protein IJC04_07085 [Oscillospiraceae bacterium]|nr:hypothetical protein [Oscillospiraceae bacterium]
MSNFIFFDNKNHNQDEKFISMSNGLTDVFINVLVLAGSKLAEAEEEKQLIVWLAENDQRMVGNSVDFDIVDMPWHKERFDKDKQFIINVIEAAKNKTDWDKLDYEPNEEWLFEALNDYKILIKRMTEDDVISEKLTEWISYKQDDEPVKCGFPRCNKHNTFLSRFGCQLCNNK